MNYWWRKETQRLDRNAIKLDNWLLKLSGTGSSLPHKPQLVNAGMCTLKHSAPQCIHKVI